MSNDRVFRGGIQPHTVAFDNVSRKLDTQCKSLRESFQHTYPGLTMQKKLRQDQIPGGIGGCEPDGGAWFIENKLMAVFEGKKQGVRGNAIERWFKNNALCRDINPDVCYVTFCVGEGAANGEVIKKTLNIKHYKHGWNVFVPRGNSGYLSPQGFTDEFIHAVMKEVLGYCAPRADRVDG